MVLFKDLNKSANDLITKDFAHEKGWEAEIKSKTGDFLFTQNYTLDTKQVFDASAAGKYSFKTGSVEIKALANGSGVVDAKFDIPKVKGLSFQGKYDYKNGPKGATNAVDLSTEYTHKCTHAKLSIQPLANKFVGSFVFNCNYLAQLKTGAEVEGTLNMQKLKFGLGAACIPCKNAGLSLKTVSNDSSLVNKVLAHAHYKKGDAELGAECVYAIAERKAEMSLGVKYDVDKNTSVKAKIDNNMKTSFSISQALHPLLSATFGAQLDAANLANPDSIKYGVKLNISH